MSHLFVDISAHGFGHLAQTGPVLNALAEQLQDLRLTVRSGLPTERLKQRIALPFEHLPTSSDISFLMHDAVSVDREASAAAYRRHHADWQARVAGEAGHLKALSPDLVLSNVSALPLAAARMAGIPCAALCSLNWADQFSHLFSGEAWAAPIEHQLLAAYAGADVFLRCIPAAPMPRLGNVVDVPPIVRVGNAARAALAERLQSGSERLVLVTLGGIDFHLDTADWPVVPGVRWLVREPVARARPDILCYPELGWHFSDLLASVDALVTKPGYGMFVEAAAAATPVLYLRRDDWPEQEALIDWLQANAACAEVGAAAFAAGDFLGLLEGLWRAPRPPVRADGAAVAAGILAELLRRGC